MLPCDENTDTETVPKYVGWKWATRSVLFENSLEVIVWDHLHWQYRFQPSDSPTYNRTKNLLTKWQIIIIGPGTIRCVQLYGVAAKHGCKNDQNCINKMVLKQDKSSTELRSEFHSYCSFSHQNCLDSHHHGHTSMTQIYNDHCHIWTVLGCKCCKLRQP